jgi:peroxiredoxin
MKNLKILYLLPLLFLAVFSANAADTKQLKNNNYTISGVIKNLQVDQIILQEIQVNNMVAIDTATVNNEGKFEFKGTASEASYVLINFGPYRNVFLVIEPDAKIKVDIDAGKTLTYTVKNSPASADLAKMANLNSTYNQKILDLNEKLVSSSINNEERAKLSAEVSNLMAELKVKSQEQIKTLQTPIAKIFTIEMLQVDADLATEESILAAIEKKPASKWYSIYKSKAQARLRTAVGAKAPDITLNTPEGEPLSLSSLKGKYVLIDFWASWCRPCRRENPNVVKVYNQYKDKGFEILGVSLDKNASSWNNAIAADGLTWKHVSDLKGWQSSAASLYSVSSIPQTILLDKDGKIIAKNLRGAELEKKLASILQ